MSAARQMDDIALHLAELPSRNRSIRTVARLQENTERHDDFERPCADVHSSVPDFVTGNGIRELWQPLLHTHTPTSDSERLEGCVAATTLDSLLVDSSTHLRRTDSCVLSSSGHPISAAAPRSASLAGRFERRPAPPSHDNDNWHPSEAA